MLKKQAKNTYPAFMLIDLNAEKLNLTQDIIETFISNAEPTIKTIFNLYYVQGFSQNYITKKLNIKKTSIRYHLSKLKTQLKKLAQFWNNDITLIIGRSGTGKSTLEEKLCDIYSVKSIKSYTTRPKRYEHEDNHIFISKNEINNYPNKIATTTINDHFYFATKEQLDESQIYVIDPNGLYELTKNFPNLKFNVIYLKLTKQQHKQYLKSRRNVSNETTESQNKRLESENKQFDEFEKKIITNTLPKNVILIKTTDLLPNYKTK